MKSVHEMSCQEVNNALAKIRGEENADGQWLPSCVELSSGETVCGHPHFKLGPPDYCHDWAWAGKLLEKMLVPQLYKELDNTKGWRCEPCWDMHFRHPETGEWLERPGANAPTPTEAIARAALMEELGQEAV